MKRFLFVMAAGLFVEATGLHADNTRGTEELPYVLNDSVAVTANHTPTPLAEIASSISVISRKEIERSQSAFVSHLLRNVAGVEVVQSGGVGKFTSVFIRGSNAHHALILLDGIPLNDPSSPNNAADISNLMTANVERIEILRGPQSVLYGPDAIGGVVQIFTKAGEKKSNASVSFETGSLDSHNLEGTVCGIRQKLGYAISAKRLKSSGVSSADDASERDGYENNSLSSRLDFDLSNTFRINFVSRYTESESDLDKTSGIFDDPDFVTSQTEQLYQTRIIRQLPNSNWHQQLAIYYGDIDRTTSDDFDTDHPSDSESTSTTGHRIGASFQHWVQINSLNKFSMGIETEKIDFTSNLFFRSGFGDFVDTVNKKHSWTRGIYLFDQFHLFKNMYLTLGGRLDEHRQFGTTGTYRLTAAYLLGESGTRFRGVIGSGYKAPSVFQLYNPSPYIGNPNLKPEKSNSWELGVDQKLDEEKVTLSLTYFDNDFKDLIVGIENVDEATSNGVEAGIEKKSNSLRYRIDYTYCDSKDKITNEVLIRRPRHKLVFSTDYEFTDRFFVNLVAQYTGKREDLDFSQFPAPRVVLQEYTVVNLAASYEVIENLRITGRIENLFDEDYQEVYSYGSVPFSVYAGFKIFN